MYEQAFNFSQRPFQITPTPEDFYPGQSHQQAVEASRICIQRRNGPVVLIGSVGAGKSLTMQVIGQNHAQQFDVVSIECSRLEQRSELLQSILFGLKLPFREMGEGELRLSLIEHLKSGKGAANGMLLLVDEADRLSIELLDELRLITNVVRDGRSQVQLVLSGTQRLEESLNDPRLASFNQRIASRNFLQNLSHAEVAEYISQHIARAGGQSESVFTDCAIAEIARCTDGCPRLINQVCENALAEAADDSLSSIDEHVVQQAWARLQNLPVPSRSPSPSSAGGDGCDSGSESVVEFGSLSDDQEFDSSYSVGGDEDEKISDAPTQETFVESADHENFDSESSRVNDEGDQAAVDSAEDAETVIEETEETEEDSLSEEMVAEDETSELPEVESDSPRDWSGRLPTNLGFSDFRMNFDDQSNRYAMPSTGVGSDPFAPEATAADVNPLAIQDSRESGNLDETSDFTYGKSFSSSTQEDRDNESAATDSRIEALHQEQKDLLRQVDAVDAVDSVESADQIGSGEDDSPQTSTNQDDVNAAFAGLEQIDQARSAELPQAPVEAAVDPFAEDFEEEVMLQDTYSPFVARQNQSSLTVTSENLSHLTPRDEDETVGQTAADDASTADENVDVPMTNLSSGFSFPTPSADASFVPVQSVPTEPSLGNVGGVEFDADAVEGSTAEVDDNPSENNSSDHDESIDPELAALTSDFPFEDETEASIQTPSGNFQQTPDQEPQQYHRTFDATGRFIDSPAEPAEGNAGVVAGGYFSQQQDTSVPSISQFGKDAGDRVEQEIRDETEGIARELRSSIESDVSRENEQPNQASFFKSSTSVNEDSDESGLDANQQILRDILEQQRVITEQQQADASQSQPDGTPVDSISVEYPITDHQNYQSPSEISNDDRDMLRVSETQYKQPPKEAFEDRSPLADETPSTGEAQRMDYGQLFDQLRNLPKD